MATSTCYVTTASGVTYNVYEGVIHLPRMGVWHADLELEAPSVTAPLSGKVTVTLAQSLNFAGTLGPNGITQRGTVRARIFGGGGGLSTVMAPKGYRSVPMRIPLLDLLQSAGEILSNTADPSILTTQLPFWIRMQQTAGMALSSLLQVTGSGWRVLPDGTIWCGTDTWPPAAPMDIQLLQFEPDLNRYEFVSDLPSVLPGQTLNGQRVSTVVHYLSAERLRGQIFFE